MRGESRSCEVMKVYPPVKLKVFVDDMTASRDGRNKELQGLRRSSLGAMRMEVGEKVLRF